MKIRKRIISLICIGAMLCTSALPVKQDISAEPPNPTIANVLEILKHLAGMSSVYDSAGESPTIGDALEILKYLADMDSVHGKKSEKPGKLDKQPEATSVATENSVDETTSAAVETPLVEPTSSVTEITSCDCRSIFDNWDIVPYWFIEEITVASIEKDSDYLWLVNGNLGISVCENGATELKIGETYEAKILHGTDRNFITAVRKKESSSPPNLISPIEAVGDLIAEEIENMSDEQLIAESKNQGKFADVEFNWFDDFGVPFISKDYMAHRDGKTPAVAHEYFSSGGRKSAKSREEAEQKVVDLIKQQNYKYYTVEYLGENDYYYMFRSEYRRDCFFQSLFIWRHYIIKEDIAYFTFLQGNSRPFYSEIRKLDAETVFNFLDLRLRPEWEQSRSNPSIPVRTIHRNFTETEDSFLYTQYIVTIDSRNGHKQPVSAVLQKVVTTVCKTTGQYGSETFDLKAADIPGTVIRYYWECCGDYPECDCPLLENIW